MLAELKECVDQAANWPMVVITFIVCFTAVVVYLIHRLTSIERMKTMFEEEDKFYSQDQV
jgi:hypothetical protein